MSNTDSLSLTFAALSDPTRRAILARLSQSEASVSELAAPFAISLPAVSKHLKVLENAGLIRRGRAEQWRPCRLDASRLREASDWISAYRMHWEDRLDRLEEYLHELQSTTPGNNNKRTGTERRDGRRTKRSKQRS